MQDIDPSRSCIGGSLLHWILFFFLIFFHYIKMLTRHYNKENKDLQMCMELMRFNVVKYWST